MSVSGTGSKVYIPITDDDLSSHGSCISFYSVQYRFTGATIWQTLSPAPQSPLSTFANPSGSPASPQPVIIIPLLADGQQYDLQIQRFCCDGSSSEIISTTFTT